MDIKNLLRQVYAINKKYKGIAKVTGENFNIFRILKVESKEVRTHSAFLAELLNPQGSHGQGDSFLKAFFQSFKIEGFETFTKINAQTYVEEVSEYGRIDIVIKPKQGPVIVIENKIYASDQDYQLGRYKKQYQNCHLLYLTLYGTDPHISSITDVTNNEMLKKNSDYFTASYKHDIINWLLICRNEAANHPLVRETITQYINLIKHLTHQTINEEMSKEIVSQIISNPEDIETAQTIANAWESVQLEIMDQLKHEILKKNHTGEISGLKVEFDEGKVLGKKDSGFWFYKQDWKCCICFWFETEFDDLLMGITTRVEKDEFDYSLKTRIDEKLKNKNLGKVLGYPDWIWVCRSEEWEKMSWKNVLNQFSKFITEAVNTISKDVDEIGL